MKKLNSILSLLALASGIISISSCKKIDPSEDSSSEQSSSQESDDGSSTTDKPSEQTSSEDTTLTGFDVESEVNASYGNSYTLPTFTPMDQNNNIYSVTVKVVCDGKDVTIVNNKIDIDSMKDYVVTFTVEGLGISKTMTIKVKDLVNPTITLSNIKTSYVVNESITLPQATIVDNVDSDLSCSFKVVQGETTVLDDIKDSFTLTEVGKYSLVASSTDSSGNIGEESVDFIVRKVANKGEVEDFSDALAYDCVSPINNNDGSSLVSEYVNYKGKDAIKITSTNASGDAVKYPGLALTPRLSKDDATALLNAGFTSVSVEYYIDYTSKRNIYQKWDKQQSYATTLNTWSTVNLPLADFVTNYDKIASGQVSLFFIGNEADYVEDKVCATFDFYVASVYVTKDISKLITFTDNGINNEAACNSQIEVNKVVASCDDATFTYSYEDPNGNVLEVTDGKISLTNPGIYQIIASANEKCYTGSATYQIVVKATLDQVNALINEILAADDITTMADKAATLKAYYATLSETDAATIDKFSYIKASNLLVTQDDVIYYFDTTAGKDQVSNEINTGTALTTKQGITFVNDVKYGTENGSTKVSFEDADLTKEAWPCPYTIVLDTPAISDLSSYSYIRFYIQGYSWKDSRPMSFAVTIDDKRVSPTLEPIDAKNGEWVEVLIPVSSLTGQIKIKIYSHNGTNLYGSVWNNPAKMYVYLSNIKGVKSYNDFAFASDFTLNDRYETNSTLSLEKLAASASSGSVAATKYVLVNPDGSEQEVTSSTTLTLANKGNYELKAYLDNGTYYNAISKEFVVADPITVADVNALIDEILAADDITTMTDKAATLKEYYADLSSEDKATINAFNYIKATNLLVEEENVIYYFDSTAGKDQITNESDGTALTTKNGISFVSDVKYGTEKGSTKVTFSDAATWSYKYGIVLNTPAISDLSSYDYIRFYVQGYSWKAERPITFAVYNDTKRIAPTLNPVDAKNGEWVEVLIPTSSLTGKVWIAFWSHNGSDSYGSIWNDPTRMYVYLSNIKGVKGVSGLVSFASDFEVAAKYDTGATLSLEKMAASGETVGNATKYVVVNPDGSEQEVTSSTTLTLTNAGTYAIKAMFDNGTYYGSISKEFEVVAPVTVADVNALIDEILAADDITTMADKAATLKTDYASLSSEDKATINTFNYLRAANLVAEEEDTIYYFDTVLGKEQVSNEINTGTALTTKQGITFVSDVKYGTENGSTKVSFEDADLTKEAWPCPYSIVLDTPAISDLSSYQYIRFYIQGYSYSTSRPMSFAVTIDDKRVSPTYNPVDAKNGEWVEVLIPVSSLTGQIKIKIYSHNGTNLYGSVWNNPAKMYVYLSNIKGVKAYKDFAFASDFEVAEYYYTNSKLDLSKLAASASSGSVTATKYVLVKPDGSEQEITSESEVTLDTRGEYVITAYIDNGTYYNAIDKSFMVSEPEDGVLYVAKAKSNIVARGYGTDKVANTFLDEFEGVENVVKASTVVADGASTNAYKWPGFDLNSILSLEEIASYKAKGYTNFVLPIYFTGTKEQDLTLNEGTKVIARLAPNKWNYVEISVDTITSTSMEYFAYLYNSGKGSTTEAETDIIYYIGDIYLKQAETFEVLSANATDLANYVVKIDDKDVSGAVVDETTVYGSETSSVKYVYDASGAYAIAFYFNKDFDLEGYDKAYVYMQVSNSTTDKIGYTLYNGASRVVDLRHVYLTQGEWYKIEIPTSLITNLNTFNIRVVCNLWGSAIPTNTTFNFSNVYVEKSNDLVMASVAYGKDIVRASYVGTFNEENDVYKISTNTSLLASSNSWKYPGFKVYMPYTLEELQALQEEGYTALNVRLYVEDTKQTTQTVKWGLSPNDVIATIETNKWQDVALPIATLISNYSTYFTGYGTYNGQYLFYIDNNLHGSSADYINVYTSTVTFVK